MPDQLLDPPNLSNIHELLAKPGTCFYIPAFQRAFAWEDDQIERIFEDLVHGIHSVCGEDGANGSTVTFMGTIVCFQDNLPFKLVHPFFDNDFPSKIQVVIDGQQRLTMAAMLSIIMHDLLRTTRFKFKKSEDGERPVLEKLRLKAIDDLRKLLINEEVSGDQQYYPKIIRGDVDIWSVNPRKCKYLSPVSSLISQYIAFIDQHGEKKKFTYKGNGNFKKMYDLTKKLTHELVFENRISDQKFELPFERLPNIIDIFSEKGSVVLQNLFSITAPSDFFKEARDNFEQEVDDNKKNILKKELNNQLGIARALLIYAYFLRRVKLVQIVTTSDEYAYRIFDSLNTTGDPLTAFETFKPEVIHAVGGSEKYHNSEEQKIIEEISKYLDNLPKTQQTNQTKDFLVQFALSDDGRKLSRDLSIQRRYLMDRYKRNKNKEFIQSMLHLLHVFQAFNAKPDDISATPFFSFLSDPNYIGDQEHAQWASEARFCLSFIISSKHKICASLLSRFYSIALELEDRVNSHLELCKAICATAAFFAIWRISRPDTDNIDAHHRRIMRDSNTARSNTLNFRRTGNQPNFIQLNNEFIRLLTTDHVRSILDSDSWSKLSVNMPIYENEKSVAKFILLLDAYHPCISVAPAPNEHYIFSEHLWRHKAHSSLEHIKSQSSADHGTPEENDKIHSIGNLTLLPVSANSYIGDADPRKKKLFYELLVSQSSEIYQTNVTKITQDPVKISELESSTEPLRKILGNMRLPFIQQIIDQISKHDDFNFDAISERGDYILSNAWNILQKWIGPLS